MQDSPAQFDLSPETAGTPLPRLQWVWLLAVFVFGFLIVGSLFVNDKPNITEQSVSKVKDKMLELQLCTKSVTQTGASTDGPKIRTFEPQIDELLEEAKVSASAQRLRVVLRREDNQDPFAEDLKNLAKSAKPDDQAFAKLYTKPIPGKDESLGLLKQINHKDIAGRLATVQVKEAFGDSKIRAATFDPSRTYGLMIVSALGIGGFILGSGLWFFYFAQRQAGRLLPKGLPMGNIDWGRADRLMLVALIVIMTFITSGQIIHILFPNSMVLAYLPIFVAIPILLKVPIFGWKIGMRPLGLEFDRMPEKLGWVLAAFLANIPVLTLLMLISAVLMRFLPGGAHPIAEDLMNNPKPAEIAKMLFLASVVAPIWEEIVFRGMLLPAFTKAFGTPLYGALLTSFIFASIHPQGAAGVPMLMGIALMLSAVSYQTKSLVSNIILHALHNGTALVVALVVAPILS